MFCRNCGKKISEETIICPNCGAKTAVDLVIHQVNDAPSIWLAILGFLIPIIGFILWIAMIGTQPLRAKSCIDGVLARIIIVLCIVIIYIACFFFAFKYS